MLKTRKIAIFIALFAFIFTYLYATPLPHYAIGDKFVATFKKLNGTVTVEQINEVNYTINLIFNKGFDENAPDRYFIDRSSFASVGITIDTPKAGPWNSTGSGDVDTLLDYALNVTKNHKLLDKVKFVKE
ncbi:hypothetical protein C2G38_2209318 [Gigaspora rosea]|uniref:Uncharacterized protein n=1 Tax=Gigaspora rosea TaxID=44941 RepID=A0A397UQ75_9GLOM|nr:hypothetical protein C2G38_2209318 [Gigaspora rosea]CAG8567769.1 1046_t:CDS:1 [Gigaspora rosea]